MRFPSPGATLPRARREGVPCQAGPPRCLGRRSSSGPAARIATPFRPAETGAHINQDMENQGNDILSCKV
eukprot:8121817-Pyramimonas_sp.AAC.1